MVCSSGTALWFALEVVCAGLGSRALLRGAVGVARLVSCLAASAVGNCGLSQCLGVVSILTFRKACLWACAAPAVVDCMAGEALGVLTTDPFPTPWRRF